MQVRLMYTLFLGGAVAALISCAGGRLILTGTPSHTGSVQNLKPIYTIYGIGDAGEKNTHSEEVISKLAEIVRDDVQDGTILFLGDNIYPAGLAPEQDTEAHAYGKALLTSQINALSEYKGDIIFIPGNHDWNEFRPGGLDAVKRQAEYISSFQKPNLKFYPENGCAGPKLIQLTKEVLLVIIDSQWWIQADSPKAEMNGDCKVNSKEQLIAQFQNILAHHEDKQIIVALHHPLKSEGPHGGHFTFRDHVFPLTKVVKWLYVPLPVIGSIYPWYRTVLGHPQDLKNKRYGSLRDGLLGVAGARKDLIFISGHDHNLQYIFSGGQHFIVSGSGAKQNGVANGKGLMYGHQAPGFVALDVYENGNILLSVYEVDEKTGTHQTVFSRIIVDKADD